MIINWNGDLASLKGLSSPCVQANRWGALDPGVCGNLRSAVTSPSQLLSVIPIAEARLTRQHNPAVIYEACVRFHRDFSESLKSPRFKVERLHAAFNLPPSTERLNRPLPSFTLTPAFDKLWSLMAEHQPAHVALFRNARNLRIDEQQNYIINGNQYIYYNDKTTLNQLLQPILDACHHRDRKIAPPNSACFPGTRKNAICMIVAWANRCLLWNNHVLWLHGFVGCGKSAIALAIALKFERRNRLVASFFFFRNAGDRSKMKRFATTLACQLASTISEAAPFIRKAVTDEPGLLHSGSVVAQLRRLVYEPFKAAVKQVGRFKTFFKPFLIVLDGLDECEDRNEVEAFIDDMLDFFKKNPLVPLRFLITSRVEQHIKVHLENDQVCLKNLANHCSRGDLETFMRICFEAEKKCNPVIRSYIRNHGDWPTKEDNDQLVDHIGGSFIFASALFKYIVDPSDDQSTPMDRLPHTLNMNPGLDNLYSTTLSRSQHLPHFLQIISTLALMFEPLPITNIAQLLEIEPYEVVRVLVNLQAIIHIPGTDDELPVTMCHTSLRDFLSTENRSASLFVPPSYHLKLSY
ncbi:hypothetical protein MD484_g1292, partial [Candolleomyces efflorescens]